jgi:hypothetical protein
MKRPGPETASLEIRKSGNPENSRYMNPVPGQDSGMHPPLFSSFFFS